MHGYTLALISALCLTAAARPVAAASCRGDGGGSVRYQNLACPDASGGVPRRPVTRPPSGVNADGDAVRNVWRELRADRRNRDAHGAAAAEQRLERALRQQRATAREPARPNVIPERPDPFRPDWTLPPPRNR